MKKYTNKIIIIAIAVFFAAITVLFFIQVLDAQKEEKQCEISKEEGGQL